MRAAEKRKAEQEGLKASRKAAILDSTYELFSNGIDKITMNEIADHAEIGVASLYRYFSTKDDLAIECATNAWEKLIKKFADKYTSQEFNNLNGFEQLKSLMQIFPQLFQSDNQFFRFIYYFDAYVNKQNVAPSRLTAYEAVIIKPYKIFMAALKKGREDKSINTFDTSDENIYFSISHGLFSLAQKLSLSGEMLYMNLNTPALEQINLLIKIILNALKNTSC